VGERSVFISISYALLRFALPVTYMCLTNKTSNVKIFSRGHDAIHLETLSMPITGADTDLVVDGLDALNGPDDTFCPDFALLIFNHAGQCDLTGRFY